MIGKGCWMEDTCYHSFVFGEIKKGVKIIFHLIRVACWEFDHEPPLSPSLKCFFMFNNRDLLFNVLNVFSSPNIGLNRMPKVIKIDTKHIL